VAPTKPKDLVKWEADWPETVPFKYTIEPSYKLDSSHKQMKKQYNLEPSKETAAPPKQQDFQYQAYNYAFIHNMSSRMKNALTWQDDKENEKKRQEHPEGRDFITEN